MPFTNSHDERNQLIVQEVMNKAFGYEKIRQENKDLKEELKEQNVLLDHFKKENKSLHKQLDIAHRQIEMLKNN